MPTLPDQKIVGQSHGCEIIPGFNLHFPDRARCLFRCWVAYTYSLWTGCFHPLLICLWSCLLTACIQALILCGLYAFANVSHPSMAYLFFWGSFFIKSFFVFLIYVSNEETWDSWLHSNNISVPNAVICFPLHSVARLKRTQVWNQGCRLLVTGTYRSKFFSPIN